MCSEHFRMEIAADNMLTIHNVQRSNEGNYSCIVSNHLGSDEIIYPVHVQGKNITYILLISDNNTFLII